MLQVRYACQWNWRRAVTSKVPCPCKSFKAQPSSVTCIHAACFCFNEADQECPDPVRLTTTICHDPEFDNIANLILHGLSVCAFYYVSTHICDTGFPRCFWKLYTLRNLNTLYSLILHDHFLFSLLSSFANHPGINWF